MARQHFPKELQLTCKHKLSRQQKGVQFQCDRHCGYQIFSCLPVHTR